MKKYLTLIPVLCVTLLCQAQIKFQDIPYEKVFNQAKKEQKSVMLFFHFDGCPPCAKMKKEVFTDSAVGKFYNENFICFKVNTKKPKGEKVNKIYNITSHPTTLYYSIDQTILDKAVGFISPKEFIEKGREALDPFNGLYASIQQFEDGKRDPQFLMSLCHRLAEVDMLESKYVIAYFNTLDTEGCKQKENLDFIFKYWPINFYSHIPLDHTVAQFFLHQPDYFYAHNDSMDVEARVVFYLGKLIDKAIKTKDENEFNKLITLLEPYNGKTYHTFQFNYMMTFNNTKYLTWEHQLDFYRAMGWHDQYDSLLSLQVKTNWDDASELNTLAWKYYENYNDKDSLNEAIAWVERSIELRKIYHNVDTYAHLLSKLGRYKDALKQAQWAIQEVEPNQLGYSGTKKLVEELEEKI